VAGADARRPDFLLTARRLVRRRLRLPDRRRPGGEFHRRSSLFPSKKAVTFASNLDYFQPSFTGIIRYFFHQDLSLFTHFRRVPSPHRLMIHTRAFSPSRMDKRDLRHESAYSNNDRKRFARSYGGKKWKKA